MIKIYARGIFLILLGFIGFQHRHLQTFVPWIVHKASIFKLNLQRCAEVQEVTHMETLLTNLTYDVIAGVVLNEDMHAQDPDKQHPLVANFKSMIATYRGIHALDIHPVHRLKRWWFGR